ncbi:MAG: hypothetical protein WC850_01185 [Candidatus Gracilibacteria bacterium]
MTNVEAPNFVPSLQEHNPLDLSVDKEENYRIGDISVYTGNKLKIPKEVLDSLDKKFVGLQNQVIDLTKSDLNNLQDLISKANETKDYTKLEEALRKELIEVQVDTGNVKLDILSTGAKGTIPESVLNKVGSYIDTKINSYGLDDKHKENIKIAIVGRILSSGKVDELLNSFKDITKNGGNGMQNIETTFNTIIDTEMKGILSLLDKAKGDESQKKLIKEGLLSNPQAIQDYKEKGNIDGIPELKSDELVTYLSGMNNQVINLEKKGGNIKENLMATLNKMPSWLSETILGFIQKIVGFFLGEAGAEKLIGGFKKEIQNRKSVDNLLQYGNTINEKGETIAGAKNSKIVLLNDKNLTGLESKKLAKFFDNCREKGIDITEDNFWENVLNKDGKVIIEKEEVKKDDAGKEVKDKDGKEIKEKVPYTYTFANIDDNKVTPPDFTKFYEALNEINFITGKTVPSTPPPEEKTKEQAQQAIKSKIEGLDKQIADLDKILLVLENNTELDKLKSINISEIFNNKDELSLLLTPFIQEYQRSRNTSWSNNWPLSSFLNNHLVKFKKFLTEKKDDLVKEKESKTK